MPGYEFGSEPSASKYVHSVATFRIHVSAVCVHSARKLPLKSCGLQSVAAYCDGFRAPRSSQLNREYHGSHAIADCATRTTTLQAVHHYDGGDDTNADENRLGHRRHPNVQDVARTSLKIDSPVHFWHLESDCHATTTANDDVNDNDDDSNDDSNDQGTPRQRLLIVD